MKFTKRFVTFVAIALVLVSFFGVIGNAKADSYPKQGMVICTSISVRQEPNTSAERYTRLSNGAVVKIIGETGSWYIVDLNMIGQGEGQGYCLKRYIDTDVYYITLPETVVAYAHPFDNAKANGEFNKGTRKLVLDENEEWLVIQTRDDSAGSSFIKKSDLFANGGNGSNMQQTQINGRSTSGNQYVVTVPKSLAVRSVPDDNEKAVGFLHNGDLVTVIQYGDYFSSIEYELAGQITECWVHSEYLKKVYR